MNRKSFERWFARWKESDDAYRVVDKHALQSLGAGGCDSLALALYWVFPKNVTGVWQIRNKQYDRVEHVYATLRFDESTRDYGADMDVGVALADGFVPRWIEASGVDPYPRYLVSSWDTLTPIDKSLDELMSSARGLSESMKKSLRQLR